ncbi:MAG: cache domain-containing protein [Lachnospiraceae bacterium]|nr:cache domain-containing protein [Lachnospiraceae bacterium]
MRNGKNTGVIILVASLLFMVTFMDIWMVFRQTRQQTKDSGIYQLETISGELESTINDAENLTMELAIASREYIDDTEALETFIYNKKAELLDGGTGAFNIFIVSNDFVIIPDFDIPEDFVATQRVWYTGAIKSGGETYVTPPYQDAMTGDICYTVSVMLGDGETVLGVDYTMENIQAHIAQMYETGSRNAVIVTDEGVIAGCSDESLLGKKLVSALPDYAGIWSLSKRSSDVATARIKSDFLYENLFATKSGNGWYLIVSESDWNLYKNSYIQLMVTLLLSLALFIIIIILYWFALKSQKKAEGALASKEEFLNGITGELQEPISRILESSSKENVGNTVEYDAAMSRIHAAGEKLSEMIGQIMSYSSIVRTEKKNNLKEKSGRSKGMNKHFRSMILAFMCLVMLISLYTNISATFRWGKVLMQREAEKYEFQLSEWINTQKSILDMFVSVISTHPEMLDDYEGTVDYLNRITVQYPEISVTYMTNPNLEHTVYMNNGWQPDPDWHVEERQWYIDTLESETGWSISAPYYDEQTGGYCVTISERVYDAETGEFLGNFGIDFFMDKLVDILGDSYSDSGYAFLVDTEGDIINHPYGSYQMSQDGKKNVSELPYGEIKADGQSTHIFKDYDGSLRILIAARNDASDFMVYVVLGIWTIYKRVLVYGLICLVTFLACMILVYRLLSDLIRWQDETNRQMKDAADAAIAAGKAKSQFLAQMSHEIRTPINAVLGMNEMILRESSDENILDYAGNIQAAGRTLLSIINGILDFSKIEDGKMEIIPVRYDIASMINNLVNSIAERAKDKSLAFIVDVDEKLPSVLYGDDVRITQVIMNLLTNAVKYTEEGTVTLSVKEGQRNTDSVYLDVQVKDTGIGIKEEDMGRLFESFERLEEKRNRDIEGTGLGMSIVTKLLTMMGSELHVESVYGVGSVFSFRLKQYIINAQPIGDYATRLEKSKRQSENTTHLYAPGAKILVVDDNEMNRKVAKNLMKLNGIVPDQASSGMEAIEMIRENTYDIVFLDHMMPKMDGIETLARIKEEHLIADGTTMIALTANAVVGAKEAYLQAGFDDYLSKPIEVDRLEEKLSKYLPKDVVSWYAKESENKKIETEVLGEPADEYSDEEILEFEPISAADDEIFEVEAIDAGEMIQKIKAIGLSVDDGLLYCGGDQDFYLDMLKDYVAEYEEKTQELSRLYEKKNWHEYQTLVHALKSTSKTIGATVIFEQSRSLEEASGNADDDFIEKHHPKLMTEYKEITDKIAAIVKKEK